MRFSDSSYRLPQIEALRAGHVLTSGTTLPMLLEGVDRKTHERGQFVIKFRKGDRMSEKSSAKELIAAWIAMELDLPVVDPVLIHVSPLFVDSMIGNKGYAAASLSIGLNFGSKFRSGFLEMQVGQKFSVIMEEQAMRIYAFDLFITNADRGHRKDNVLTNGNEFLIFDHELAFSYVNLLSFSRTKTPWIFGEAEKPLYRDHVFYRYLRNKERDFGNFTSELERLNDAFWQKVKEQLPKDWISEEVDEIQSYLSGIVAHKEVFTDQLSQSLFR